MKKSVPLILLTIFLLSLSFSAVAAQTPTLKSIAFENAEINGEFSPSVYNYTVTLGDNTVTPTLKGYEIDGDGELLVTYAYDNTGRQTGIIATLNYENGSLIYAFDYSNPAVMPEGVDNYLSDIYCNLGEISPKVNKNDTRYTLYIPSDLTELELTPVTNDTHASCPPVKLTLSEEQTPEITLTCTAPSGAERRYYVKIERVEKTAAQVKEEMKKPGYKSFVTEKKIYENDEFIFAASCVAIGILILILLRRIALRLTANPYDENEKPFYVNKK